MDDVPELVDFGVRGQIAVVTGAGQGIGAAVAGTLAAAGAAVAVCDIDAAAAARSAATITLAGGTAVPLCLDVADEAATLAVVEEVQRTLGQISCWINNAGVSRPAMIHKMTVQDFEAVLRVHVRGTFLGIREASRAMVASNIEGVIVNVTSSAGLAGTIGQINYSAAKGAIVAMTKSAARELARYGIRVNAVSPNAATSMTETIRTDPRFAAKYLERIPLGRWAEPDEIARAFLFLVGPAARYMTGQVLCADGGAYMAS